MMGRLKISEVFCYVCRGVLIKPITLPCCHVFCLDCFEDSMKETSYECPLCRRRVSNWVRRARRFDTLINEKLWQKIIKQYHEEVNLKLQGEEDGLDERLREEEEALTPRNISTPGEVHREYTKMMSDYEAEREKMKAAEELASKQLISKLTKEEEMEIQAMKRDEEYAKKLHKQLNKNPPVSTRNKSKEKQKQKEKQKPKLKEKQKEKQKDKPKPKLRLKLKPKLKQKKKKVKGPMDNFVKNEVDMKMRATIQLRLQEALNNRCASTGSSDSIQAEMHHFKPIRILPRTPPKRYPDGKLAEISVTEVKPLKAPNVQNRITSYQASKSMTESKKIHSPYSAFTKGVTCRDAKEKESPRKRPRTEDESGGGGVKKEMKLEENGDINSTGQTDGVEGVKRKRDSPVASDSGAVKKQATNDIPAKQIQSVAKGNAEENGNSDAKQQVAVQDLAVIAEGEAEPEFVEEQKRIEILILQERDDYELAVKLNDEWQGRYELRNKSRQKQVVVKNKTKVLRQTLIAAVINTRVRKNK